MSKKLSLLICLGLLAGMTTAAKADTTVVSQFGKTTIAGKTYVDGSHINARTGGPNGEKLSQSGTGFDVKRFYLTIEHRFDEMFSARFRTDIESGDSVAHPNEYNVFVKNAWVQAKLDPALTLRAGVADLPWVPYVEGLYGYRYVEHVLIDRAHFGTSADLGLNALGTLDNGLIDYQLAVINGGGYHNIKRSKTVDVSGRIGIHPVENATFAVGAREGKLGAESFPKTATTSNTAYRLDAVAAWVSDALRIGVDGFYAKNYSSDIVVGKAPDDKAFGVSGWLSFELPFYKKLSVFGRYDYVKPHDDTNSGQNDNYANAGLQYQPTKPLKLALVYKFDKINQSTGVTGFNATNIKASGNSNQNAYYDEIGVFAQYKF